MALPAAELVGRLAAGQSIDFVGLTVQGDLDLRPLSIVPRPLRCRNCRFMGSFNATDVIFERIVDLSGSVVEGPMELEGALAKDAFLLQSSTRGPADLRGRVNLRLATFEDVAGFDDIRVAGPADFSSARFADRTSFSDSRFEGDASFDRSSFGAESSFSGSLFHDAVTFSGSVFGARADFRQVTFESAATFSNAIFEDGADFMLAEFRKDASFERVTFQRETSFRLIRTQGEVSFSDSVAAGPLHFEGADFECRVFLSSLSVAGALYLTDVRAATACVVGPGSLFMDVVESSTVRGGLFMDELYTGGLWMGIPAVSQVQGDFVRQYVLSLIERTAQSAGDLALANEARYRLLSMQGSRLEGYRRALDTVGYKAIAGYLVRPSHPLAALVTLVILASICRRVMRLRRVEREGSPRPGGDRSAGEENPSTSRLHRYLIAIPRQMAAFGGELHRSLRLAFSPRASIEIKDPDAVRSYILAAVAWAEFLGYKVLIALFLLALGNSNATFRQVIDAIRG